MASPVKPRAINGVAVTIAQNGNGERKKKIRLNQALPVLLRKPFSPQGYTSV